MTPLLFEVRVFSSNVSKDGLPGTLDAERIGDVAHRASSAGTNFAVVIPGQQFGMLRVARGIPEHTGILWKRKVVEDKNTAREKMASMRSKRMRLLVPRVGRCQLASPRLGPLSCMNMKSRDSSSS
ncbi:hypothetical protein E4U42_001614 [Claviceps africana]|uniref:Uncharacterized protein n=1 Tax=Claviceps africana TaxID=83212 RepID=A0A8K0J1J8_9HYPO|nr:hypothetical protein E4U42_001614 [Claviceps africana]